MPGARHHVDKRIVRPLNLTRFCDDIGILSTLLRSPSPSSFSLSDDTCAPDFIISARAIAWGCVWTELWEGRWWVGVQRRIVYRGGSTPKPFCGDKELLSLFDQTIYLFGVEVYRGEGGE